MGVRGGGSDDAWLLRDARDRGGEDFRRSMRLVELRNIGPRGQGDAELVFVARLLIVLRDAFSDFSRGHAYDGIGRGVVIGIPAEDFDADGPFFQEIGLPGKSVFDDEAKECREALAVTKVGIFEQTLELLFDRGPLLLVRACLCACRHVDRQPQFFQQLFLSGKLDYTP